MKSIAAVLILTVWSGIAPAQPKTDSRQLSPGVRIYEPKNIGRARAIAVAQFVSDVLAGGPVRTSGRGGGSAIETTPNGSTATILKDHLVQMSMRIYWDDVPRALVIRGGTTADQDAAEALLKRFDVPEQKGPEVVDSSRFEVTAYLVRASNAPAGSQAIMQPVPADLQGAVEEMKRTFGYKDYSLWDTILTQAGSATTLEGILPEGRYGYALSFASSGTKDGSSLYLYQFEFSLKRTDIPNSVQSKIAHNVSIQAGQKLVLGKIRLLPNENADLFLVLTAKAR